MQKFSAIFRIFLFVLFFVNTGFAQPSAKLDSLDKYIAESVKKYNLPGLSIGIVKGNTNLYSKAFGVANTETGKALSTGSLFGIASLSKAFTAASIGILIDEGKLNWDDRVIDYLPWFKLSDVYATREMRIRDLLCHRSGLATFDGDLLWYGSSYTRKEVVKRIAKMELKNGFRYKYGYQNIMFIVAGEVIEAVSGKTWDEFISQKLLSPIGMNSTTTTNSIFTDKTDLAYPHLDGVPQKLINYDNCGPAASLNSSVDDMSEWIKFWLNKGKVGDKQILSEKSYYEIMTSHTALNGGRGEEPGGRHFSDAALGWFLRDYSGRKVISHGGGLPGYISQITIIPEDSLGIIVLTNDDSRLAGAITNKVIDLFLNDNDIDYAAKAYENYEEQKQKSFNHIKPVDEVIPPTVTMNDYTGLYTDVMYGDAEVKLVEGKLIFTMLPTKELFTGVLEHYNRDTYRVRLKDPFLPEALVTFSFNSRGKIQNLTVDLPNPDFHFENLNFIRQ